MHVKRLDNGKLSVDKMLGGEVFEHDGEHYLALAQHIRQIQELNEKWTELFWVVRLSNGELVGINKDRRVQGLNGVFVEGE